MSSINANYKTTVHIDIALLKYFNYNFSVYTLQRGTVFKILEYTWTQTFVSDIMFFQAKTYVDSAWVSVRKNLTV